MEAQVSSDDAVGYGKPPKKHQFKKGQSGCPDGGREQKKAKKERAKKEELDPGAMVVKWFTKKKKVKINGKAQELSIIELALMQLEEDVLLHRDPAARKLLFDVAQKNGWFKPPPRRQKASVLVVSQIKSPEQWAKDTEGELLPRNPLHGIPGFENWEQRPKGRRATIPDVTMPDESE
jgi:hypothetical protein